MIQVKKTRKSKSLLAIIITSVVLALMLAGIIVMAVIMNRETETPAVSGSSSSKPIYPPLNNIASFEIESHNGYFGARYVNGIYYYYYKDDNGERQPYYPPICYTEPGYNYTSLYAITSDGMNAQKLSFVLYAMSNPSYESRIELAGLEGVTRDEQLENYESQLKAYGLDKEGRESIVITYYVDGKDENGQAVKLPEQRTIYIGNKLVTGTGYYLKLDGDDYPEGEEYDDERDDADKYVYVSSGAENFAYALEGFMSFVKPSLVMSSSAANGDTAEIPQLTTSYRQWANVVRDSASDVVKEKTKVIFTADIFSSAFSSDGDESEIKVGADGYISTIGKTNTADLDYLSSNPIYDKFIKALVGKNVGDYSSGNIITTVILDQNGAEVNKTYSYKIYEIEAVIDESGTEYRSGTVGDRDLVKVRYSCSVDGEDEVYDGAGANMLHAVIDLSDSRIPTTARESIRALSVGELADALAFNIIYTEDNSTPTTYEYRIKHISNIIDNATQTEVYVISDKTSVIFTYQVIYNGQVVEESYTSIDLSKASEDNNELYESVKAALLSAQRDENGAYPTNITAYVSNSYFQAFKDFTTYEIKSIDYFVECEEIVSFKYEDPDQVDNFIGGAIHINTLKDSPYSSYDLDMESCDRVIKVLSGTLPGASSQGFDGLTGSRVVAVGLTPENMKKYGLYAYTVYYELPRFVDLDENTWKATVGFTLHISENNEGKRYVGSDMYDIVVEIDAETFDFVEKSFVDFWARRDLPMIEHIDVDNLTVEFNIDSLKGKYSFMVEHPDVWMVTYEDPASPTGEITLRVYEEPADDTPGLIRKQKHNTASIVNVAVSGESVTETLLVKLLKESGKNYINIHETYYHKGYENQSIGFDYLGEAYFRDVLYAIYSTCYAGTLTEEEVSSATAREAVMSFSFGVSGSNRSDVYRFYYTDSGRVAVEIDDGARRNCHFYITNHAFKGIVNAFYDLVNGNVVEINAGYRD